MTNLKIKKITGKIRVETGLHIGAGSDTVEIGGMDNPVIRNPLTREPYIPGSSIKGKMRSLMEWYKGRVLEANGNPCSCGKCDVCIVFGCSAASTETAKERGPTRLIVRDALLSDSCRKESGDVHDFFEEKNENTINRITAKATPRPVERVVPGVEFDLDISFRIFNLNDINDDEKLFKSIVLTALALLQEDYIGGGGSRGSGKVTFRDLKDEENSMLQLEIPKDE